MKGYLLDTCAVSEWIEPLPNPGLMRWLDEVDEDRLHSSVITLGALRKRIELLPAGARRQRSVEWLTGPLLDRPTGVPVFCPWAV
ncbi:hypothetical protein AB0H76_05945 [Nocardia sp. NPDC050712]|uniref:hypothetical protein n=1 Tax=Nocardia sp. NPDC050712 TaxID=3155518 RepID=UPI0033EC0F3B